MQCHYAERHYAERHCAECHYAECRGAKKLQVCMHRNSYIFFLQPVAVASTLSLQKNLTHALKLFPLVIQTEAQ